VHHQVYVAEDDVSLRAALQELLEENGYEVSTAENGAELLELLRAAESLPCVVLLDLMMPQTSGWEVLDELKSEKRLADVPVIVVSAWAEKQPLPGDVVVLKKPFRREALLKAVTSRCRAEKH
jgi:CheY-like chemotaxis protein